MPQGLQVWDAAQHLALDLTDSITRVAAVLSISAGASGTFQLPEGRPFWCSGVNANPNTAVGGYAPAVSVNGSNLLSYSTGLLMPGMSAVATVLIVGVY